MESVNFKSKKVKNPESMSTEELIEFADEIKGDLTSDWLKRRKAEAVKAEA